MRTLCLFALALSFPALASTSSESAKIAAIRARVAEVMMGFVHITPITTHMAGGIRTESMFGFGGSFTENDFIRFFPTQLSCKRFSAESKEDSVQDVDFDLKADDAPFTGGLTTYHEKKKLSWGNAGKAFGDLVYYGAAYVKKRPPGTSGEVLDTFPLERRLLLSRESKMKTEYPEMLIGWGDVKYPWRKAPENTYAYVFEHVVELPTRRKSPPAQAAALAERLEPSISSLESGIDPERTIETFTKAYLICTDKNQASILKELEH